MIDCIAERQRLYAAWEFFFLGKRLGKPAASLKPPEECSPALPRRPDGNRQISELDHRAHDDFLESVNAVRAGARNGTVRVNASHTRHITIGVLVDDVELHGGGTARLWTTPPAQTLRSDLMVLPGFEPAVSCVVNCPKTVVLPSEHHFCSIPNCRNHTWLSCSTSSLAVTKLSVSTFCLPHPP